MRRHWAYLKYVIRHKYFVYKAGRKLKVPFISLIIHDWDKFLPSMWFSYARTFYNPDGTGRYQEDPKFAEAWNGHQKRNKHHWQYWLLTWDSGGTVELPMPRRHWLEMLADWQGAGRALGKTNTHEWYSDHRNAIQLHQVTRFSLEEEMKRMG